MRFATRREWLKSSLEGFRILPDLKGVLLEKLKALGMGRIMDLESKELPAIIYMEGNGFPADKTVAKEMAERYAHEAEAALEKITELLPQPKAPDGTEWSWTKPDHVQ